MELCPEEITLSFLDAKLSIGCQRGMDHSGKHYSSEDSVDVSVKKDWRNNEPSQPTIGYVYIEWET